MRKLIIPFIVFVITIIGFAVYNSKTTYNDMKINNEVYNSYNDNISEVVENKPMEQEDKSINDDVPLEKEETKKASSKETKVEIKKEDVDVKEEPKVIEEPKKEIVTSNNESITGNMSGYGYDCYGCTSGRTSSGYDITNGNIYYNDSTYGNVRIVAGDRKYPFGTIIKVKNYIGQSDFYAIVLDRGSNIGLDKKIQFDLVYEHNSDAEGLARNVTFEIIRLGY